MHTFVVYHNKQNAIATSLQNSIKDVCGLALDN